MDGRNKAFKMVLQSDTDVQALCAAWPLAFLRNRAQRVRASATGALTISSTTASGIKLKHSRADIPVSEGGDDDEESEEPEEGWVASEEEEEEEEVEEGGAGLSEEEEQRSEDGSSTKHWFTRGSRKGAHCAGGPEGAGGSHLAVREASSRQRDL
jgi:hypothetical protein